MNNYNEAKLGSKRGEELRPPGNEATTITERRTVPSHQVTIGGHITLPVIISYVVKLSLRKDAPSRDSSIYIVIMLGLCSMLWHTYYNRYAKAYMLGIMPA